MIKHAINTLSFLCAAACFSVSASTEALDEHSFYHQEVHVHGIAELTVTLEQGQLEINLESPAMNIVGFEHAAETEAERQQVDKAQALLNSPEKMFTLTGGTCAIESVSVDATGLIASPQAAQAEHEHELREQEHSHHGLEQQDSETHSQKNHKDFDAQYLFTCSKASGLTAIEVNLLGYFPGIKQLNAMWVTVHEQNSKKLDANNKIITLKQ